MAISPTNKEFIIRVLADHTADTLAELDADLSPYEGDHVHVLENDVIYFIDNIGGELQRCPVVDPDGYITSPADLATETTLQKLLDCCEDSNPSREQQLVEGWPEPGETIFTCEVGKIEVVGLAPQGSSELDPVFDVYIIEYETDERYTVADRSFLFSVSFATYCTTINNRIDGLDSSALTIDTVVDGGDSTATSIGTRYRGNPY